MASGTTNFARQFQGLNIDEVFTLARDGDASALDEYCKRVRPGLIQIASFQIYDITREEAEDLAHETLAVFVQKYQEVTTSSTAYLRSILYNNMKNFLRGQIKSRQREVTSNGGTYTHNVRSSEHEVEKRELLERAEQTISGMSEPCKTLLIGLIEGYKVKELWERMLELEPNLRRSTFDRRLYVCRRRLWELLGIEL
ncbi:MAG: hypothetical protein H6508_08260 [Calditrichaeota bacterium]|nr:hypothetical protein [Calditrichota bacterium]